MSYPSSSRQFNSIRFQMSSSSSSKPSISVNETDTLVDSRASRHSIQDVLELYPYTYQASAMLHP